MNSAMMYDDLPAPKVKVKKKQSISPYRQGIHLSFPDHTLLLPVNAKSPACRNP